MRAFLLSLNSIVQAIFIIAMTIGLAFIIALLVSQFFDEQQLILNTELTSAVYQVMGTIYGILLTFTLWGVWQHFTEANTSVQTEAYALIDLVHAFEASLNWKNSPIREAALNYAKDVIHKEWPLLKNITDEEINLKQYRNAVTMRVIEVVQNVQSTTPHEETIFGQALQELSNWLDARRTRLLIARGNSAKALWPLLLVGAFVLFAFHGLFVAKTVGIWAMLLFGTSVVIGTTYFLIFALDCPFSGFLSTDAEPFNLAINVLGKKVS